MISKIKTITLTLSALLISSAPAFATAVTTFTATDATSAVPTSKGTYFLDFRLNGGFPGNSFILPTVNFIAGVWDNVELGIGSGLNFSSLGTPGSKFSVETAIIWARIGLPLSTDFMKTAVLVGSQIPVYQSSTAWQPGIEGSVDFATWSVTTNVNFGYSRTFPYASPTPSGDNILSGNLNFTLPFSGFSFFEEQFVNYPVGGFANGGFRMSVFFPPILNNKLIFDINPAVLFSTGSNGISWVFSPNAGLTYIF